jgi:membrane protein implicated in regulation of membrane protease activity
MQTKKGSALEATLNVLSGFFISWAVWVWVVAPLYGYETGYVKAISITMIFTVSSLIRSYLWRRFFNNRSTQCLSVKKV